MEDVREEDHVGDARVERDRGAAAPDRDKLREGLLFASLAKKFDQILREIDREDPSARADLPRGRKGEVPRAGADLDDGGSGGEPHASPEIVRVLALPALGPLESLEGLFAGPRTANEAVVSVMRVRHRRRSYVRPGLLSISAMSESTPSGNDGYRGLQPSASSLAEDAARFAERWRAIPSP